MTTSIDVLKRGGAAGIGYAASAYLLFTAVTGYAVAFLADTVVPRTVDEGGPTASTAVSVVVDALLLSVFAVQHTVMARPAFKRRWTRVVPAHLERATYVFAASASLALTFALWHPVPDVVWDVGPTAGRVAVWAAYVLGWLLVVAMTHAFDHAELFGLRQPLLRRSGQEPATPQLSVPLAYRLVRHPMMTGFVIAFWAAPTMTVGHLLFAALSTAYVVVGVRFEERDLAGQLSGYEDYAARTPRFVPWRLTR
ncbi:isoprenylcysteine carboxylmethyltransferase family protein [Nocardioides panacisoli]|uniref:Isoprenylcysteine carboxylmethyltransferase family protein n=1 Tax=Nocardioides panacisoli TaxID=627624 RepID=A0ABP7ISD3_9ACTN